MTKYKVILTTKVEAYSIEDAEVNAFENIERGKFNLEVEEK